MCCGEKSDGNFARNVKKPSMFLSSLILKRRDNRRAMKPRMLLDAVLTSAINNIKDDKLLSKLTNISRVKKFSNCIGPYKKNRFEVKKKHNNYEEDNFDYRLDVDHFFEELKNVKIEEQKHFNVIGRGDACHVTKFIDSEDLTNQEIVDNFIETGIKL